MKTKCILIVGIGALLLLGFTLTSFAARTLTDEELRTAAPAALSTVPIPEPPNLGEFVVNKNLAVVLGKALFWDMQVGSDGMACASCHFHAGADNRAKNQLSTGFLSTPTPDFQFDPTPTGGGGPNYTLKTGDFPFPASGGKDGVGLNDIVSSLGVFKANFDSVTRGQSADNCTSVFDDVWNVGGINVRRVEPRNTPTVINAVFNHRNFWDGRANNIFNGVNPLGKRGNLAAPAAGVTTLAPLAGAFVVDAPGVWELQPDGSVLKVQIEIDNASLASQAVGPPLSEFEMSCAGRTFPHLGRKMLSLKALAQQMVHPEDSVLRRFRSHTGYGLSVSYEDLIKKAFHDKWWGHVGTVDGEFAQIEANFSLFWGLAIQLYEATLVADRTPFDRFAAGDNNALWENAKWGLEIFLNKGKCINCHTGPEFTAASVRLRACQPDGNEEAIERMIMGDGNPAVYDGGFYNIGVRPTFEDLAVGADLAGFPLSFARQEVDGPKIDAFCFDPARFEIPGPIVPGERVAVDGAFKTPTVRNVLLTAPYFHSGGHATLLHVVEFYDRGGDFAVLNRDNLDPDIQPLGFTPQEERALVAFMRALTDNRVKWERAPFDHPQLFVPDGHVGDEFSVVSDDGLTANDDWIEIPAVGKTGRKTEGLPPLQEVGFDTKLN
ncbi:MAG: hypothetical protein JSW39_18120 [Desulfobacterales bacterium]|nr:MAG: hypothetical protein JSW39_18120 [Desulfobacterales bacterium]